MSYRVCLRAHGHLNATRARPDDFAHNISLGATWPTNRKRDVEQKEKKDREYEMKPVVIPVCGSLFVETDYQFEYTIDTNNNSLRACIISILIAIECFDE